MRLLDQRVLQLMEGRLSLIVANPPGLVVIVIVEVEIIIVIHHMA